MWGSDVWAPGPPGRLSPQPPVLAPPHTPWAPPGLAPPSQQPPPLQQNAAVANQSLVRGGDIDQGLDYHPFRSLSNIWSPSTTPHHHSTIWQPPTSN
ncbi:probable pathogenesis-related protein ARB_02861 [Nilaparvata lugens]|nr:probable pathogenesis-related protein ARB_02861 [Nilaparvata lugens]